MKFEIDVEIPAGYEPTGEYRPPKTGEFFLAEAGGSVGVGANTGRRLILREKPLAYEDFEMDDVSVTPDGLVSLGDCEWARIQAREARSIAAALIAAAAHVDRVNAQKKLS